jgi:hypothetical protein
MFTHVIYSFIIIIIILYQCINLLYIAFFTLVYYVLFRDVRNLLIQSAVHIAGNYVLCIFLWKPKHWKVDQKKDLKLRRTNRASLLFNSRELEAINLYCDKYRINNRSKFMREAIMTEILKKFDEDYPTLFEFERPNLFYSR